ncbi:MAG: hypothetical protein J6Y57_04040 [Lachnospiraceae bacterium]|nr:hypothetical protein [Lachnospiraceae bacterium]
MDNHYYRNEAQQIITELCDEFSKEEMKLKVKYDNNCSRLEEMDQQIRLLSRTENVEMKVFSPRRHIASENDKVSVMKKEREELDKQNRETERDYRYYSKRAEKMRYLCDLMERNEGIFTDNSAPGDFQAAQGDSVTSAEISARSYRDDLEKIQKKLDNCYHFIDSDVQRAKMEIKNLLLLITELMDSDH